MQTAPAVSHRGRNGLTVTSKGRFNLTEFSSLTLRIGDSTLDDAEA